MSIIAPKYDPVLFFRTWCEKRISTFDFHLQTRLCRLRSLVLFLIFNFSIFTIHSCGLDVEDPTPPSPPAWVQKSLPEEWPERGVDAHELGGIYLEWQPNPESNISAYLLYRAKYFDKNDSLGGFKLISRIETDSNHEAEYIDSDNEIRVDFFKAQYFYKLKAEDLADNTSAYSDSIYYILLPQISLNSMTPNGAYDSLDIGRSLNWGYNYNIEMENYCVTVLSQNNELILREILNPENYVSGGESWSIPDSIVLDSNIIYKWRIDTGARFRNGVETAGSESAWALFRYGRDY
jgi:hypothetical protein